MRTNTQTATRNTSREEYHRNRPRERRRGDKGTRVETRGDFAQNNTRSQDEMKNKEDRTVEQREKEPEGIELIKAWREKNAQAGELEEEDHQEINRRGKDDKPEPESTMMETKTLATEPHIKKRRLGATTRTQHKEKECSQHKEAEARKD